MGIFTIPRAHPSQGPGTFYTQQYKFRLNTILRMENNNIIYLFQHHVLKHAVIVWKKPKGMAMKKAWFVC